MSRGQAATEFIMTYGWALLAVLVAMGALAYFGVWSPKSIMPDTCDIGVPFTCYEYAAYRDGVAISLRYGGVDRVDRLNISITGCGAMAKTGVLDGGDTIVAKFECAQPPDRTKLAFNVTYHSPDDALDEMIDGRVILRTTPNDGINGNTIQFCHNSACTPAIVLVRYVVDGGMVFVD